MSSPRARALAKFVVPGVLIGVMSALSLIALSAVAEELQQRLWVDLPGHLDVDGESAAWIIGMLTAVGLVVGLVVWLVPGHAGPDPATQTLVSPPLAPGVLPGVAVTVVIGLAGGVSLGPENPIVAINVGLAVWLGRRFAAGVPTPAWVGLAAGGTIGAMFGTPVGAALALSEAPAAADGPPIWDRMFAPLVAAAAGSLTMVAFEQPDFALALPAYPGLDWHDLISAPAIACAAVLVGLVAVYLLPWSHAAFQAIRHPVAMLTAGGLLLGVLGAIGGSITLFKGLDEMKQLVVEDDGTGRLAVIMIVKLAAVLVAATCGFRGGRIFPMVFVGVAIGLLAHQLVDEVPAALAVGAAVLGITLVVTRSGWLSLFLAAVLVGDVGMLPVLCVALLPAWLLVTDRPPMEIEEPAAMGP